MNSLSLAHHNQLTDWCDCKWIHQEDECKTILHKTKQSLLLPNKHQSINEWCTEVNRLFIKPFKKEPPHLLRKCKYSNCMFSSNKSRVRSQMASCTKQQCCPHPEIGSKVRRTVLTGKTEGRPQTATDKDEAVVVMMAENSEFCTQDRKIVHLNIQPQWKRKLSTGWTINRHMLYPKVPPPPPPENLLVDIPNYLTRSKQKHADTASQNATQGKANSSHSKQQTTTNNISLNEQMHVKDNTKSNSHDDDDNECGKSTQFELIKEGSDGSSENKEEHTTLLLHTQCNPFISDRSISNNILNVLSVDDCKMMMRYRPKRVVDTQDAMIIPISKRTANSDQTAEDSSDAFASQNAPIRLSHGSAKTILSPSQVQSLQLAHIMMHDTCCKNNPEINSQYSTSAAVEKAFKILLDERFQSCHSSRRPLSSSALVSYSSNYNSSCKGSNPSSQFQQRNAVLRQKMCDLVDFHKPLGCSRSLETARKRQL